MLTVETPGDAGDGENLGEVIPPPPPSPLDGLKEKLAARRAKLYHDLEVPRFAELGLRVFVRFSPLDPSYAAKVNEKWQQRKTDDWSVNANAEKLAHCCVGVYATDVGDTERKYSLKPDDPDGEWTKFDHYLAVTLGLIASPDEYSKTDSVKTCRALYATEGDLLAATMQLADWSSLGSDEAERDFQTP